jgi:hypothetical protein
MIDYIYTERTPFFSSTDDAIDLLIAANEYDLERLKKLCEKHLVMSIDLSNVIDMLCLSDIHQAKDLRRICISFCVANFDVVTKREEFKKLSKEVLLELISSN